MRIVACIVWIFLSACHPFRVNESQEHFFPPELGERLANLQAYPGAWWNYIVISRPSVDLCELLKKEPGLGRVGCRYGSDDLNSLLGPWLDQLPLRTAPPSRDELLKKLNLALAKASAPVGPQFIEVLRNDPLGAYEHLIQSLFAVSPIHLDYRDEFLRLPQSDMAVIPVLFDFKKDETTRISQLRSKIESECREECGEVFFIGPHFGTDWNRKVVKEDMARVSFVGTLLFVLFLGFLVLTGRWTALFLTIPVGVGVVVAAYIVNIWQGSIHGLTIAFGSSLTGIAFDYAFHAFVRNSGVRVWWANIVGYFTTIAVFFTMVFSEIPLIREIMVFAIIGITVAIGLFYFANRLIPERFQIEPFSIAPMPISVAPWVLGGSLIVICVCVLFLRPDFSLQGLEQSSKRQKEITRKLFGSASPPILVIHEAGAMESEFVKEKTIASEQGIRFLNRLTFLPTLAEQRENLTAWQSLTCAKKFSARFSPIQQRFFAPFFSRIQCDQLKKLVPSSINVYSRLIQADGKWLSTFFPLDSNQESILRAAFPSSFSLREVVNIFPSRIQQEMTWMTPIVVLMIGLIVWLSYGSWKIALSVFIPFVVGAAFSFAGLLFSPSGFGFVSIVGLLMVLGISTDFGIFCANYYINSQLTRQGIWTALFISGLVSLFGFIPLLFADHVVLRQLGEPLVLGTLGTLVGTFFVQPWWMRYALVK